jgi:hypothetical protein
MQYFPVSTNVKGREVNFVLRIPSGALLQYTATVAISECQLKEVRYSFSAYNIVILYLYDMLISDSLPKSVEAGRNQNIFCETDALKPHIA